MKATKSIQFFCRECGAAFPERGQVSGAHLVKSATTPEEFVCYGGADLSRCTFRELGLKWQTLGIYGGIELRRVHPRQNDPTRASERTFYETIMSVPSGRSYRVYHRGTLISSSFATSEEAKRFAEWIAPAALELEERRKIAQVKEIEEREAKQREIDAECAARAKQSQALLERLGLAADVQRDGRIVVDPVELDRVLHRLGLARAS